MAQILGNPLRHSSAMNSLPGLETLMAGASPAIA
jgi:hypothetical protein